MKNSSPGETKPASLRCFGALSGYSLLSIHLKIHGKLLTVVGHVHLDIVAMCCTLSSTSSSSESIGVVGLELVDICLLVV